MLPALTPDISTRATESQVLQALASLAGLPSRQADDAALDQQMYFVALDGVSRYALSAAVKSIIRGSLGHTFFPSPVEFRQQCENAMEPHIRQAERVRIQEAQERERAEFARTRQGQTQASRERVAAAYAKFCASYTSEKDEAEEAERADIRARYGMTDELIDAIPDQPVPSNFKKLEVR